MLLKIKNLLKKCTRNCAIFSQIGAKSWRRRVETGWILSGVGKKAPGALRTFFWSLFNKFENEMRNERHSPYGKKYKDVKFLKQWLQQGMTVQEIAEMEEVSRQAVYYMIKKFNKQGHDLKVRKLSRIP